MSKMILKEEELQNIIQESIYEIFNKEKGQKLTLPQWYGFLKRGVKDTFNKWKAGIEGGERYYNSRNLDSNPNNNLPADSQFYTTHYTTQNRQKKGLESYNAARNSVLGQNSNATTTHSGLQPNPDTVQNQQPNKLQQVRIDNEREAKQELYKSGLIPQGPKDAPTGWIRKDGQKPNKDQLKLIDNWKRVKLHEAKEKLSNLLEQLDEIGDTDRGQYALGKLCKRQEKRDSKNARETDAYKRASKEINKTPHDVTADAETFKKNHKKRHNMAMSFDNGYYGRGRKSGIWDEE